MSRRSHYEQRIRRARRDRQCDGCRATIAAGNGYAYDVAIVRDHPDDRDGVFSAAAYCERCVRYHRADDLTYVDPDDIPLWVDAHALIGPRLRRA